MVREEEEEEELRRIRLDLVFETSSPPLEPPFPLSARSAQRKALYSNAAPRKMEWGAEGCPQGKHQEEERWCRR